MARIYATAADYQAYSGQPTDTDTDRLLGRAAAFLDAQVFRLCHYIADPVTTLPSDPIVAGAFRDAVCAQVEWWAAVGESIGIGGVGTYGTVRIGTVHMQDPKVGTATTSAARQIAPAVWDALQSPDLAWPVHFQLGAVTMW
ncbi:hypothetical protein [Kitasatospora viridis]|uniref:Uncharacterized protein n=1 Tax=Kitasatospora viridis TaxID=281105 RepID=A0A561UKM6_9ACTN|nr:hypothetical protein [Kitasatospora viridis]TWF99914.1 hypothetical protein FHX73_113774 [Kitasatospora viridis]